MAAETSLLGHMLLPPSDSNGILIASTGDANLTRDAFICVPDHNHAILAICCNSRPSGDLTLNCITGGVMEAGDIGDQCS